MSMRRLVARLTAMALVLVLVLGHTGSASARETTQGEEAGLAICAVGIDLAYVPAKVIVATGGLVLGGVVGLLTGGDVRSAYALWVPAASGTYIVTAAHLDGSEPIEFFGSDYADTPSSLAHSEGEGGAFYRATYETAAARSSR